MLLGLSVLLEKQIGCPAAMTGRSTTQRGAKTTMLSQETGVTLCVGLKASGTAIKRFQSQTVPLATPLATSVTTLETQAVLTVHLTTMTMLELVIHVT